VVKVFDGQEAQAFSLAVRKRFETVKRIKPPATRNASVEFFLVATGFQPA
jgi:23S rRNA U2552 (ribose-2'-O)-methylase RlmE/FtsJ